MALFLVIGEYVETGALLPPQQVVQVLEHRIFPSFEGLVKLEEQKKILAGGMVTGARAGAFIMEAASNSEISRMLMELPFWGIVKWDVKPLDTYRERLAEERKIVERLKQSIR